MYLTDTVVCCCWKLPTVGHDEIYYGIFTLRHRVAAGSSSGRSIY